MADNEGASQEAIQFHYDLGNSFYAAWLDETMTYTAALWPDEAGAKCDLLDAQLAKLDWHLDAAGVKPGQRLLDVGCGWGSVLNRAVEKRHVSEAVGLTLAHNQVSWINEKLGDRRISVRLCPWQEHQDSRPYDAIISIGALEHFARPDMSRPQKLKCYRDFFEFCSAHLVDGGRLSLQAITWMNMAPEDEKDNLPVHIFPQSNLPHVVEVLQAADPYFHMMDFTNRPRDYAKTLRQWMRRMRDRKQELIEAYGRDDVNRYMTGFTGFVLGFQNGIMGLSRFSFEKRGENWSGV